MDALLDQYDIHLESLKVDFTDFIDFLKQYRTHLGYSASLFSDSFYSMYSKVHDDSVNALSKDVLAGKDMQPEDKAPIDRIRRMQKERAEAAAVSFFKQLDFFQLNPDAKELFISSVGYCLLCRYKFIADPMDHQIRNGLKPKP
jgi:hypothetical protein